MIWDRHNELVVIVLEVLESLSSVGVVGNIGTVCRKGFKSNRVAFGYVPTSAGFGEANRTLSFRVLDVLYLDFLIPETAMQISAHGWFFSYHATGQRWRCSGSLSIAALRNLS